MMLPPPLLATLASALFLFAACDEPEPEPTYDESMREQFSDAMRQHEQDAREAMRTPRSQGDVNAVDWYGRTELAEVSEELEQVEKWMNDSLRDGDAEQASQYREEAEQHKARIRELLRAGADPWARSLSRREGKLGNCAIQFWSQAFIEELRAEDFDIPTTPTPHQR